MFLLLSVFPELRGPHWAQRSHSLLGDTLVSIERPLRARLGHLSLFFGCRIGADIARLKDWHRIEIRYG